MYDPYEVLGLDHSADTDSIRRRYLELVRRHSPEREPERFSEIRAAYDELRDPIVSLEKRLFDMGPTYTLEGLAEQLQPDIRSARIATETLLAIGKL